MVALAQWIEAKAPDVVAENRVWDFLGEPPNRVRRTLAQVADCDREITLVGYDSCRGVSLAQRDERARLPDESYDDYRARLREMRSDRWEGSITYDMVVAGPAGIGVYVGKITNTGSGETIVVHGKIHPFATPLGTISGKSDITVTGYTDPDEMIDSRFGVIHFLALGVAGGPLDLGSIVASTHTSPNSGITTLTIFPSRGGWDLSNWKFKPGLTLGMAGLKNVSAQKVPKAPSPEP